MYSAHLRRQIGRASRAASARWSSTSTSSSASSAFWRNFRLLTGATTLAATSYYLGALYPPGFIHLLSPRPAPAPLHPEDPAAPAHIAELEEKLNHLPVLAAHRARPDKAEWYETRPYLNLPEERRVNSLTAGTLKGPGKLAIPPLVRARHDAKENWVFIHVGRALCGHEGVIHGGLLATLLDETLARVALLNLPEKVGVTANLNINYKAPTRADQFIVIKVRLDEAQGRKSRVSGVVEDMAGNVLVEANALFIQPRYAKLLNSTAVRHMLGEPSHSKEPITPGAVAPVPVKLPGGAEILVDTKS
ncbi:Thioesterase/thiol ester dehydrase-isomerase [Dichomitus squalens]|uniref:Thioesterase/thiol ester dehydrase-isomerase n=1 Tax=Dichomitus squalens TaxID=114155 RepID=A0A4Q9NMA6_9APHY|nr:Thioesterase/thiol ester dehydrase-isomerase [Dichomitus squalens]TBU51900.1 Thioesterase/thiol ester dehydrase-isomerase [Dichomitus squalens]